LYASKSSKSMTQSSPGLEIGSAGRFPRLGGLANTPGPDMGGNGAGGGRVI
jgi:hypothetical protein